MPEDGEDDGSWKMWTQTVGTDAMTFPDTTIVDCFVT